MPDDLSSPNGGNSNNPESGQAAESQTLQNNPVSSQVMPSVDLSSQQSSYPQIESKPPLAGGEQPSTQTQPVLETTLAADNNMSSQQTEKGDGSKGQKTILLLAIMFFVFSLVGLVFYVLSGVTSGRFSLSFLNKKEQMFTTPGPSPMLVEETPVPTSVKESSLYSDSVLSFEYPVGLTVAKAAENLWLVKTAQSGETVVAITLASSQKMAAQDFLVNEVLKLDKKLDKASVKSLTVSSSVGNYTVYSYTLSDNSALFVFEDKAAGSFVKVSDFSNKIEEKQEENVVEKIISTFSLVKEATPTSPASPIPTAATPSATTRFNTEE